jgi:hypothetical protein
MYQDMNAESKFQKRKSDLRSCPTFFALFEKIVSNISPLSELV